QNGARGPRALFGQRLNLGSPCRQDRKFCPDEERVGQQQEDRKRDRKRRAHISSSWATGSIWRMRKRSIRRPSIRPTVSATGPTTISSPTRGTRPSSAMTNPPKVSY